MQGIIAGTVTVGQSQPACSQNQSCTEDLAGYSLVFEPQCGTNGLASSCQKQNFTASIAPSRHYSILLAPGNYTITGLSFVQLGRLFTFVSEGRGGSSGTATGRKHRRRYRNQVIWEPAFRLISRLGTRKFEVEEPRLGSGTLW